MINSKKLSLCTAFFLLSSLTLAAQTVGLGKTTEVVKADLFGDKNLETLKMVCYRNEDSGYLTQLVVNDNHDKEIWRSPRIEGHRPGPWSFGKRDDGVSDIQLVGDIDQDGRNEMISPGPMTSDSPLAFRVYRWGGSEFTFVRQACLVETGDNVYDWKANGHDYKTWIGAFTGVDGDWVKVDVYKVVGTAGEVRKGKAVLVPQADNRYKLIRWVEKIEL